MRQISILCNLFTIFSLAVLTTPCWAAVTVIETGGTMEAGATAGEANLALETQGGVAFASSELSGWPASNLNDGDYTEDANGVWIDDGADFPNSFFGASLATATTVDRVAFKNPFSNRSGGIYDVQVTTVASPNASTPDASWTSMGTIVRSNGAADRLLIQFPAQANVTGVRLVVTMTQDPTAVSEIEIYEELGAGAIVEADATSLAEEAASSSTVTFTLPAAASGDVVMNFLLSGTATFDVDYSVTGADTVSSASGTVTIADGQTQASITITAIDDTENEADQTVNVQVDNGVGYTPGMPKLVSITILDDDQGVLEVTHTPQEGQYDTVQGAIYAALEGDIVRIIDNSAPFVEQVTLDRAITLEGLQTLSPRPTIEGTSDSYQGVGGVTIFPALSAAGATIQNLIVDGRSTSISFAGFSGLPEPGLTINNCRFIGPDASGGGASTHNHNVNAWFPCVFNDCEFAGVNEQGENFVTEGGGTAGKIQFNNCTFTKASVAISIRTQVARSIVIDECDISTLGANHNVFLQQTNGNLTISNTIFRPDPDTGSVSANGFVLLAGSTDGTTGNLLIEHCDFIGKGVTNNAVAISDNASLVDVNHNIFHNCLSIWWIDLSASSNADLIDGAEDYNVYSVVENDLEPRNPISDPDSETYTMGSNNVFISAGGALYANESSNDYRIKQSSAANFGGGDYAGSQGIYIAPNNANNWEMFN